ncbi:glass [Carabus blaptoides fortunei]
MEQDTLRLEVKTEVKVEEDYDRKVTIKLENVDDKFTLVDVKQIINENYRKQESIHEETCKIESEELCSEETDKSVDINTNNVNQKHLSAVCTKSFVRANYLKTHMKAHENNAFYSCEVCHRTFIRNVLLKRHMASHSADRTHKCSQCNKQYLLKSDLNRHLLIHKGHANETHSAKS